MTCRFPFLSVICKSLYVRSRSHRRAERLVCYRSHGLMIEKLLVFPCFCDQAISMPQNWVIQSTLATLAFHWLTWSHDPAPKKKSRNIAPLKRVSDSCNVSLPINQSGQNELAVYSRISTEMYSSEFSLTGTKTMFRLLSIQTEIFSVKTRFYN